MLDMVFNKEKAEAFGETLLDSINKSAVVLSISLGHRVGLFDTMNNLKPSTSAEIAEAAGLNERYVREWLGAMVTGKVVSYEPTTKKYELPAEHASILTRASTPNFAATMQFIPVLGAVEDKIVEAFRNGGGVPYSEFPRFHEVMADESGQTVLPALIDAILPLAPGLPEKLESGIKVLDIGCGRGRALMLMAKTYPNSSFTGYDFSDEAVATARQEAAALGLTNVTFEVRDVAMIGEVEKFDLITAFDAIHDQAKPAVVLSGIFQALKPDGTFLMQDVGGSSHVHQNMDHPIAPLLYTISTMHCMTVSLALDGDGLGTMWGKELAQTMLKDAGFRGITIHDLPHDVQNCYYVIKKNL